MTVPHAFRHLVTDLAHPDRRDRYRLVTDAGELDLRAPQDTAAQAFTLTGPGGPQPFVLMGVNACGRGGRFDLTLPDDRALLRLTTHAALPTGDEHLGLHAAADDAGLILRTHGAVTAEHVTTTLLSARHAGGALLWFRDVHHAFPGLPAERYVLHDTTRLAGWRAHHTPRILALMALPDEHLCARGVDPANLPHVAPVSARHVHPAVPSRLLLGEALNEEHRLPEDFEWNAVAYLHAGESRTRTHLQTEAQSTLPEPQSA